MNKAILIGNLVRDLVTRETPNGKSVATLSIAVKRPYSEETDFFNAVVWDKKAENCAKFLKKGSKVGIVGYLYNRSYEGKDGVKRNVTEIMASEVEFLTPRPIIGESEQEVVRATHERKLDPIEDNQLPF